MSDALARLRAARAASPLDLAFASFLASRVTPEHADAAALAGALVSLERSRGHTCFSVQEWAGRPFPSDRGGDLPRLPGARAWTRALQGEGIAGDGSRVTPLVLCRGRVYLYRYWAAEERVARRVRDMWNAPPDERGPADLAPLFRRLFPRAKDEVDGQALAASSALRHRMTVLTGGPGTGKTTAVARLLALALARDPDAAVALAAPTGKAAARLTASLRSEAARMPGQAPRLPDEACQASTLHRLLEYRPLPEGFRRHGLRPLPAGLLVVDEASMVDLLLMDALLDALPTEARLVLLGDRDQLASVEAGYVLGDLCRAAERTSASLDGFHRFHRSLGGRPPAQDRGPGSRGVVVLERNFRFERHPDIGALAGALRDGSADRALGVLASPEAPSVSFAGSEVSADGVLERAGPFLERYGSAASAAEALELLSDFRILCVTRGGPRGVERLNATVEARLRSRAAGRGPWYAGRPVLVTANDHRLGLWNGDVGVAWPDPKGRMAVHFPAPDGTRALPPARLPAHATAWALTVHKAQGSEFGQVLLLLPEKDILLSSRQLLYTAVTRARERVEILGSEDVFRAALDRTALRLSGLAGRLLEEDG